MCSPQWPAGGRQLEGGPHGRAAKNRAAKNKVWLTPAAATSSSSSQKKKKKSTQENAPEPACHSYAKTVRAVLTTPDDALCCGACQYRARCLGEREVRWGLVEARRGSWGPGNHVRRGR